MIASIFILSLVFLQARAASPMCADKDTQEPPAVYRRAVQTRDSEIHKFAQQKASATLADAMFSQLMEAKSPMVGAWMKTHHLETESEDDVVRAWRDYFAQNFILTAYPQKDAELNKQIERLVDTVNHKVFETKTREHIDSVFKDVQALALKRVASMALDPKPKAAVTAKLQKISLHWMDHLTSSNFSKAPMEFLDWTAAYDPGHNQINIGLNILSYPNDETLSAVFAHEMGHAVDSCRWGQDSGDPWPFKKVGDCLRGSVGARVRDDKRLDQEVADKHLTVDQYTFIKKYPTCNKSNYPPIGVQADQLPEVFADWFSAEVMASGEVLAPGFRADLCADAHLNPGSSYVANSVRLEGIYLAQPDIRKKLKLTGESKTPYCGL